MASTAPKRPPCSAHGLATGPDGRCALCRRSEPQITHTPLPVAVPGDGLGAGVITRLLGLIVAMALAGGAVYALAPLLLPEASPQAEALPPRGPRPSAAAPEKKPEPPKPTAPDPAELARLAEVEAAAAQAAQELERKRQLELETAEQDRRRSAQIEADREARARKRARSAVTITMYSTNWCPSCSAARQYMKEQDISFTEHDIDATPSARAIMKRLNPRGSVPTIDIDGEVLVGFSSASIDDKIEAAVRKRSGG